MLFNSFQYLFFLTSVVIIIFCLPPKYKCLFLLAANYLFYGSFKLEYTALLMSITAISYFSARILESNISQTKKKVVLIIGMSGCILILAYFKYLNFILDNMVFVLKNGKEISNGLLPNIILPIGISFYIFQAIGYMIDSYRDADNVEQNFIIYALFLSFFPQIVSGPIERGKRMFPQYREFGIFIYDNIKNGMLLMCWGFFEKLVIANRAAMIVNEVYSNTSKYWGAQIIVAMLTFSIQIYADFAGYTHIAIGSAQVLGIELQGNFSQPYFAVSIKDFWRRWHISLSEWLRDYIYIPLGGNRCGKIRNAINILVTFLISGIWHGAGWNFVLWAGIHGSLQILEKATQIKSSKMSKIKHTFDITVTFLLVSIAWVFFRCESFKQLKYLFAKVTVGSFYESMQNGALFQMGLKRANCIILILGILVLIFVDIIHEKGFHIREWLQKQSLFIRWSIYCIVCITLLLQILNDFGASAGSFIYAQF